MKGPVQKAKERPAESTGLLVGFVVAVCSLFHVKLDTGQTAALAIVIGSAPAVVSYIVDRVKG